jgi:hypothetical protein
MKRTLIKRQGDGFRIVTQYDHHFIANRANGFVRGRDERDCACGGWPTRQLLPTTHATAAAGGENHTDATITICGGHSAS